MPRMAASMKATPLAHFALARRSFPRRRLNENQGGYETGEGLESTDRLGNGCGLCGRHCGVAGAGAAGGAVVGRHDARQDQGAAQRGRLPSPHLQLALQGGPQCDAAAGRRFGRRLPAAAKTDRHVAQRDRAALDVRCPSEEGSPRQQRRYADRARAPSIMSTVLPRPYSATKEPKRGPFSWPSSTW
jgi:hypothetical protein